MGIFNFVARQAQNPGGFWGKMVARVMTRMTAPTSIWAVEVLDVQPGDSVLEVGFGAGVGIRELSEKVPNGAVTGVEISRAMIELASKRNAKAIESGKIKLIQGHDSVLPLDNDQFDRACSINTVYVMEHPGELFREMHRVLKRGGAAAIAFPVRENFAKFRPARSPRMHLHELEDLQQAFEGAGFENIRLVQNESLKFGANCLIGTKSEGS